MERKLASIQRIAELTPIEGADKIERAKVLGWDCVVKKGEFKVGDSCIYIEIDSLVPRSIWSGFLFKESDKSEKYRLKTIKLKGQISQGLVLPANIVVDGCLIQDIEGLDVTQVMGIEKYVPYIPANLQGIIKSTFPSFIPKTDEERVQNLGWLLEQKEGSVVYLTEKVDGSSMTVYLKDGVFGVCSRNMELVESENNAYWKVARRENMEAELRKLNGNYAIQGELIGQGIQGNKYKLTTNEFLCYNIFNIDEQRYLNFREFLAMADELRLITVPILGEEVLHGKVEDWLKRANINSLLTEEPVPAEGIVVRGQFEEHIDKLGRFSFKAINNEFLLKYKDD